MGWYVAQKSPLGLVQLATKNIDKTLIVANFQFMLGILCLFGSLEVVLGALQIGLLATVTPSGEPRHPEQRKASHKASHDALEPRNHLERFHRT